VRGGESTVIAGANKWCIMHADALKLSPEINILINPLRDPRIAPNRTTPITRRHIHETSRIYRKRPILPEVAERH